MRANRRLDLHHLVHQLVIERDAAGGVVDHGIEAAETGRSFGALGDLDRVFARDDGEHVEAVITAEHRELFHRGRAAGIERGEQNLLLLAFLQALGDLRGGRGLARALQADHEDTDRRHGLKIDRLGIRAEHGDKFVIDDLHHHLAGRHRLDDIHAHRAARTFSVNSRTTSSATSASSSARRTSRIASATSASLSAPRRVSLSRMPERRPERPSNMCHPRYAADAAEWLFQTHSRPGAHRAAGREPPGPCPVSRSRDHADWIPAS